MSKIYSKNTFPSSFKIPGVPKHLSHWKISPETNIIPKDVIDILQKAENYQGEFFRDMVNRGQYIITETSTDNQPEVVDNTSIKSNIQRVVTEITSMKISEAQKIINGKDSEDHGLLDIEILKAVKKADSRAAIKKAVQKQIDILFQRDETDE